MSNCYNQPCQWSTDNRTLRGAWTIAFNPSWVSEVMWRFQLFSPCRSHTLEVTTEVTLGWEQHEGKDEQHLPWLDSVIWHGSMAGKRAPISSCCVLGFYGWRGLWWTVFCVVFYQRAVCQSSGVWVFVGCLCSSLIGSSAAGIVIHPHTYAYKYIYMQILVLILIHFEKNTPFKVDGEKN